MKRRPTLLQEEFNVAGITHEGRARLIARLSSGDELQLRRDPSNFFDGNAVAIHVALRGWVASAEYQIGFVPRSEARRVAKLMDEGASFSARVAELGHFEGDSGKMIPYCRVQMEQVEFSSVQATLIEEIDAAAAEKAAKKSRKPRATKVPKAARAMEAAHPVRDFPGRAAYWAVLSGALYDLEVNEAERSSLRAVQTRHSLTDDEACALHARALASVLRGFADDGVVTGDERQKLRQFMKCLRQLGWLLGEAEPQFFCSISNDG